jgi:hypothetical protein
MRRLVITRGKRVTVKYGFWNLDVAIIAAKLEDKNYPSVQFEIYDKYGPELFGESRFGSAIEWVEA